MIFYCRNWFNLYGWNFNRNLQRFIFNLNEIQTQFNANLKYLFYKISKILNLGKNKKMNRSGPKKKPRKKKLDLSQIENYNSVSLTKPAVQKSHKKEKLLKIIKDKFENVRNQKQIFKLRAQKSRTNILKEPNSDSQQALFITDKNGSSRIQNRAQNQSRPHNTRTRTDETKFQNQGNALDLVNLENQWMLENEKNSRHGGRPVRLSMKGQAVGKSRKRKKTPNRFKITKKSERNREIQEEEGTGQRERNCKSNILRGGPRKQKAARKFRKSLKKEKKSKCKRVGERTQGRGNHKISEKLKENLIRNQKFEENEVEIIHSRKQKKQSRSKSKSKFQNRHLKKKRNAKSKQKLKLLKAVPKHYQKSEKAIHMEFRDNGIEYEHFARDFESHFFLKHKDDLANAGKGDFQRNYNSHNSTQKNATFLRKKGRKKKDEERPKKTRKRSRKQTEKMLKKRRSQKLLKRNSSPKKKLRTGETDKNMDRKRGDKQSELRKYENGKRRVEGEPKRSNKVKIGHERVKTISDNQRNKGAVKVPQIGTRFQQTGQFKKPDSDFLQNERSQNGQNYEEDSLNKKKKIKRYQNRKIEIVKNEKLDYGSENMNLFFPVHNHKNIFSVPENYLLSKNQKQETDDCQNYSSQNQIIHKNWDLKTTQFGKASNSSFKRDSEEIQNDSSNSRDALQKQDPPKPSNLEILKIPERAENVEHIDPVNDISQNVLKQPQIKAILKTGLPVESLLKRNKSLQKIARIAAKLKQSSQKYELGEDFKDLLERLNELAGDAGLSEDTQNSRGKDTKSGKSGGFSSKPAESKESEKQSRNSGSTNVHNYNINNYQNINNIKNLK